jgi:hypothetical protein
MRDPFLDAHWSVNPLYESATTDKITHQYGAATPWWPRIAWTHPHDFLICRAAGTPPASQFAQDDYEPKTTALIPSSPAFTFLNQKKYNIGHRNVPRPPVLTQFRKNSHLSLRLPDGISRRYLHHAA